MIIHAPTPAIWLRLTQRYPRGAHEAPWRATDWETYGRETCINTDGWYCSLRYYKANGYPIRSCGFEIFMQSLNKQYNEPTK